MSAASLPFGGTLTLAPGRMVYVGPGGPADTHAHHAVQLVVSREAPFEITFGTSTFEARVALVPAGVRHGLEATNRDIGLVLFDRHGPLGAALDRLAREGLSKTLVEDVLDSPFPTGTRAESLRDVARWTRALVGDDPREPLSRDVRRAIRELGKRIAAGEPTSLPGVAELVGLSPTRLTHRFSREVGLPYRAFVPWLRVARAVREVSRARTETRVPSLTEAAVAAGFSDAAHLTRTFRAFFGMPPSQVLYTAELVDFDEPDVT